MQVHALREDFREKNSSTNQHIIRLESLQAEVSLLAAAPEGEVLFSLEALHKSFWIRSHLSWKTKACSIEKGLKISEERHFCEKMRST